MTTRSITLLLSVLRAARGADLASLEDLGFKWGPDKSRDDHDYTDMYAMLLDPLRESIRNVTEIGIGSGKSLLMWLEYMPNAHIYGVDVVKEQGDGHTWKYPCSRCYCPRGRLNCKGPGELGEDPRMHLIVGDSSSPKFIKNERLYAETMDMIIDDGAHSVPANRATLKNLWHLLKPGGCARSPHASPACSFQHDDSLRAVHTLSDCLRA